MICILQTSEESKDTDCSTHGFADHCFIHTVPGLIVERAETETPWQPLSCSCKASSHKTAVTAAFGSNGRDFYACSHESFFANSWAAYIWGSFSLPWITRSECTKGRQICRRHEQERGRKHGFSQGIEYGTNSKVPFLIALSNISIFAELGELQGVIALSQVQ